MPLPDQLVDFAAMVGGDGVHAVVDQGGFSAYLSAIAVGGFEFVGVVKMDFEGIAVSKVVP